MRRSGDETWSLLLQSAARTFAEKGYARSSLEEIAGAIGMLKGSLYYYIHSKEDLLYEIVRDALGAALVQMTPLADGPGSGLDRLCLLVQAHVYQLTEHVAQSSVFINEVHLLGADRRAELPEREFFALYDRVIEAGHQDGSTTTALSATSIRRLVVGLANSVAGWYGSTSPGDGAKVAAEVALVIRGGFRSV